jgi:hypothetical protein
MDGKTGGNEGLHFALCKSIAQHLLDAGVVVAPARPDAFHDISGQSKTSAFWASRPSGDHPHVSMSRIARKTSLKDLARAKSAPVSSGMSSCFFIAFPFSVIGFISEIARNVWPRIVNASTCSRVPI